MLQRETLTATAAVLCLFDIWRAKTLAYCSHHRGHSRASINYVAAKDKQQQCMGFVFEVKPAHLADVQSWELHNEPCTLTGKHLSLLR
jgi:hypothetical protein